MKTAEAEEIFLLTKRVQQEKDLQDKEARRAF